ncbi:phage repressor protein [Erwinia phage phiEt88]|uniref:transcriptional repressor n=1 Tax=Erwinia phage phiEt88 TaxID=925984 RepID=UPI0001F1FC7F|nr:transcriptional repressor [Erwinia phage phiEt88]CBX44558.1 phage repressor protein [Erwinia phage phiEt88]
MKTTFAERLRVSRKNKGLSQKALGDLVGVSQANIQKLENGKSQSTGYAAQIAEALGVSAIWLATGNGAKDSLQASSSIPPEHEWGSVSSWDNETPLDDDEVEVHFLKDIEFACGDGTFSSEDHNGFMLRFSKATLRRVGANSSGEGVLCFPATGNSMEPIIPDGTTVAVDTNNKKIVDGKLYAIDHGGLKRIKQLFRMPNNMISVRSFNKDEFPDQDVRINEITVIGRLFWYSVIL